MANTGSAMSPRDHVLGEAEAWSKVVDHVLGREAELISVSRYMCDSRVYGLENRIAKIRRFDRRGVGSWPLATEVEILEALGRSVTFGTWEGWEYSVQERLAGDPFSNHLFEQQETAFDTRARLRVLRHLLPELKELHRLGISHGDLRPENLLIDDHAVQLVDFDRATRGSRLQVVLRDWLGLGGPTPVWKLGLVTLFPKSQSMWRRLRRLVRRRRPVADPPSETGDIAQLRRAWRLAEDSGANAKGQGLAYYALSYRGVHLTGERAWQLRWHAISKTVDFRGKSVLELGCNMGLLSTFAGLHGATDVVGVDHDPLIVEAAAAVSEAFDSGARFEQVDLMGTDDWESRLGGRDVVTALSVVHWLPDQERVLRFLGEHRELIYEGHDTLDVETARLRAIGFDAVSVIMTTERDRQVLYARRTSKDA